MANSGTLTVYQRVTRFSLYLFAWTVAISQVPIQLATGLALLGWLGEGIVNKNWQVRWHPFFWPLLFYLGWSIISSATSPRPLHSLGAIADNEWQVVIMLMMFWTVNEVATLKRIMTGFFVTSTLAMAYGIWQTFYGVELYRKMGLLWVEGMLYRSVGFYEFTLTYAAFAMIVFVLAASLTAELRGTERRWTGLVALLAFLSVVGTFARGIWLALIFVIPAYAIYRWGRLGIRVTTAFAAVLVLIIVSVPQVRMRAVAGFDMSQRDNRTRLNLWETTFRMVGAHPVLGIGEDNYDYYFENFRVPGHYESTAHPHSDYLNVLVNSGAAGLVAFCLMWWIALQTGVRAARSLKDRYAKGMAAGATFALAAFLVAALTQDYYGTFLNTWHWWFVTGLIFVTSRLAEHEEAGVSAG